MFFCLKQWHKVSKGFTPTVDINSTLKMSQRRIRRFTLSDMSILSNDTRQVALPDIVLCDPGPWDFDKALALNISANLMSYIVHLLYPQKAGTSNWEFGDINELDQEYLSLLKKFDNNPRLLLNNITKDCAQLLNFCQLGTNVVLSSEDCCSMMFSNVEYTLQYKCFSSAGQNSFFMRQASQAFGITIGVVQSNNNSLLNASIAGPWTLIMTGFAAAVTDKKSTLYFVAQKSLKLLQPNTYSVLSVEKRETDSSERSSYFQNYEGGEIK